MSYNFNQLVTKIQNLTGIDDYSVWDIDDETDSIVNAINQVQEDTDDGLWSHMVTNSTGIGNGTSSLITLSNVRNIISFRVIEPDGLLGYPWCEVTPKKLLSASVGDTVNSLSSTDKRLYTLNLSDTGNNTYLLTTYPTLELTDQYELKYIKSISFAATVNATVNMKIPACAYEAVCFLAASSLLLFQGRDISLSNRFLEQYNQRIQRINSEYRGNLGLGNVITGKLCRRTY